MNWKIFEIDRREKEVIERGNYEEKRKQKFDKSKMMQEKMRTK
jgi:hypothetical protein